MAGRPGPERAGVSWCRQSGQALPLGLAFILVGIVGAFVLFNTGQVAVNKQRLSDAADSAAYSGMVWQARALNFQAYTNRAMMANDVTIGQAVSLNSWSNYSVITTENINNVLGGIPIIGYITNIIARVMTAANLVIVPLTEGIVVVVDAINMVIETSQTAMFASAFLATPDIVEKVASASDDNFESLTAYGIGGLALNLNDWKDFTQKYEHDELEVMAERTDLIGDSRDGFSDGRNWKFIKQFWYYSTPLTKHRVFYDGNTRLLMSEGSDGQPKWEWVAKDTVSYHTKIKRFFKSDRHLEVPIGWAASYATSDDTSSGAINDCKRFANSQLNTAAPCGFMPNNGKAEKWANQGVVFSTHEQGPYALDGYSGIREFRSLSEAMRLDPEGDPVLRLRAEVSMDIENTETTNDWIHGQEPFATELSAVADKMSSISIAEVYYRHPKAYRTSNERIAREHANGYNPYWDVRLAPVELTERLIALALRGSPEGSASTPGSEQLAQYGGGSDGLDIDVGGNLSNNLPTYGMSLASAMGLEDMALDYASDQFTALTGYDVDDIEAIASELGMPVDSIRDEIEGELQRELRSAVERLLRAWLSDTLGVDQGEIDGYIAQGEEAVAYARDFRDQMVAIQEAVAQDFETALATEVPAYEEIRDFWAGEITRINGELNAARREQEGRDSGGSTAQITSLENQIATARGERADALSDLRELLVQEMLASIIRHGAEFFPEGLPRDLLEDGVYAMIDDYILMEEEDRVDVEVDNVLPFEIDEEDEEGYDDSPTVVNYDAFEE